MKLLVLMFSVLLCSCVSSMKPTYKYEQFSDGKEKKKSHEVAIDITFESVNLTIKNNSSESLKLIPDECLVIDASGKTSRLINGNTLILDRSKSQPVILIPGNSTMTYEMFPADKYNSTFGVQFPPVPEIYSSTKDDFVGKQFSVILNFRDFNDKKIEETYRFKITEKLQKPKPSGERTSPI